MNHPHEPPDRPATEPVEPETPRAARERRTLRDAFHRRPTRGQIVAALLLAVLGLAATVQVQDNASEDDLTGARQADLIALINSLTLATERARAEIEQLEQTRDELRGTARDSSAALEAARDQEEVWAILAGTVPVEGPGVRATVSSADQVGTDQIVNGLHELRDAGAEAIEINDRVRVVAQTAVASLPEGQGIVVDGETLTPPYVIDAVGDPQTLAAALDFFGGFITGVEEVGGQVVVEEQRLVEIASVRQAPPLRYAEPAGQE
jgi:uncharacterized protein YlxW (UPF0749 family)